MKVLIACEESQTVCIAFRERGHEAYSCDIQEPSGIKKINANRIRKIANIARWFHKRCL